MLIIDFGRWKEGKKIALVKNINAGGSKTVSIYLKSCESNEHVLEYFAATLVELRQVSYLFSFGQFPLV